MRQRFQKWIYEYLHSDRNFHYTKFNQIKIKYQKDKVILTSLRWTTGVRVIIRKSFSSNPIIRGKTLIYTLSIYCQANNKIEEIMNRHILLDSYKYDRKSLFVMGILEPLTRYVYSGGLNKGVHIDLSSNVLVERERIDYALTLIEEGQSFSEIKRRANFTFEEVRFLKNLC